AKRPPEIVPAASATRIWSGCQSTRAPPTSASGYCPRFSSATTRPDQLGLAVARQPPASRASRSRSAPRAVMTSSCCATVPVTRAERPLSATECVSPSVSAALMRIGRWSSLAPCAPMSASTTSDAAVIEAAASGERQFAPATLRRELERERCRPFGLERTLRGNAARDRRTRIGAERSRIEARGSGSDAEAVPGSELEPGIAGKRASFRLGAKAFDLQRSATDLGVEGERDATIAKLALERSLRFASSVRHLEVERAGQTRGIQSRMDAGEIDVLDPD